MFNYCCIGLVDCSLTIYDQRNQFHMHFCNKDVSSRNYKIKCPTTTRNKVQTLTYLGLFYSSRFQAQTLLTGVQSDLAAL